jgi:hypothetical protein
LEADSWTQSGSAVIQRAFTAQTKRYWTVVITSPVSVPSISEIFLTKAYTWDIQPESLDRRHYPVFNVQRYEDVGGRPHYIEFGSKKEFRGYDLQWIGDINSGTMWTELNALNTAWAGKKPFWLKDPDGNLLFGELVEQLNFQRSGDYRNVTFDFMEIVA